ncbi:DUF3465 domain-containing protein [uncultured Neptuniibacter sp.]|uniref:DUF3465 domain-containing protein n=1 Tax=uncultured Neptuniibacter sp. TaxID=502143 RepID=UPI0026268348|nr:DUF3465 domain-containing protein [uncultured Neptuniibacter sp.]
MKKILLILIVGFVVYGYFENNPKLLNSSVTANHASDQQIADAFQKGISDLQVQGSGEVIRILPDDTVGSQHQKFILKLSSGQTLLISHNIDLAPRIDGLNKGDFVEFYGEYEWNAKGGVVHWTHHDPRDTHEHGWLKHQGTLYQ